MNSLWKDLKQCQCGKEEDIMKIINKFEPLLKKYASKLGDEDSYFDLQAFFFELLISGKIIKYITKTDEASLLGYIKKSIQNAYFQLSIKKNNNLKILPFSVFGETEEEIYYNMPKMGWEKEEVNELDFSMIKAKLTSYEYEIVIQYYIFGYQVKEIAKFYDVSSAAITQAKNRALKKLREIYNIS